MIVNFDELKSIILDRGKEQRSITAIAGPPCSGKSRLALDLCKNINLHKADNANIFGMDGFHYDNIILKKLGLMMEKGSRHTFDVGGFTSLLKRLSENNENNIATPVFDRKLDISRNCSNLIHQSTRHLIVEGNYLLLNESPWINLSKYYDTTIFIKASLETIERRLEKRWEALSEETRWKKIANNDLPNANYIMENSKDGEFLYESDHLDIS